MLSASFAPQKTHHHSYTSELAIGFLQLKSIQEKTLTTILNNSHLALWWATIISAVLGSQTCDKPIHLRWIKTSLATAAKPAHRTKTD
jgi:hypothetical protein